MIEYALFLLAFSLVAYTLIDIVFADDIGMALKVLLLGLFMASTGVVFMSDDVIGTKTSSQVIENIDVLEFK